MEYVIIVLLVSLSGLFSGLTLGLLGLDLTELERKIKLGNKDAVKVYTVRKKGNLLLCTLLLGNVAVNSTMAIFLGSIATGLMAGLISTALIVIFGEILPQAFISRYALSVGAKTVWIVKIFIFVLFPFCFPLAFLLDKLLGEELPTLWSKRELTEIIKLHEDSPESAIDSDEERILLGALSFSDKNAKAIMTPASVIKSFSADLVISKEVLEKIKEARFSRIPVYKDRTDQIIGILYSKDLIAFDLKIQKTVGEIAHKDDLITVKDTIKLDKLLNIFINKKNHIVLVYDEFGVFNGIVTLEDVVEEILRVEIMDEDDLVEDMQAFARSQIGKKLID